MMIKNKITPEIKSKFLTAINKTKETGKEYGFFLCTDRLQNLSSSRLKSGDPHQIKLGNPLVECPGKKIQGDFHTHNYFTLTKHTSKYVKPGTSDKEIKKFIKDKFQEYKKEVGIKELTIESPSPKDLLKAILYKCTGIEKTTCVGSDMGEDKVECWTPKDSDIHINDCLRSFSTLYKDDKERSTVEYEKWMIPLFDKEIIDLIDLKGDK